MKHLVSIQGAAFRASMIECVEIAKETPCEVDIYINRDEDSYYSFSFESPREAQTALANLKVDIDLAIESSLR